MKKNWKRSRKRDFLGWGTSHLSSTCSESSCPPTLVQDSITLMDGSKHNFFLHIWKIFSIKTYKSRCQTVGGTKQWLVWAGRWGTPPAWEEGRGGEGGEECGPTGAPDQSRNHIKLKGSECYPSRHRKTWFAGIHCIPASFCALP